MRPFAAGDLTIPVGIAISSALITAAFGLIFLAGPWQLLLVMAAYLAVTLAYSASLKRRPVVDVFALTALYVMRIVAGGVATNTRLSTWLLAFALFLFLSLAFIKRYSELLMTTGTIAGRGYRRDDALWMHAIGTSSGFMAVLVLALYVNSPEVSALYTRPQVIWFLCPILLFWLTRLWFRAGRGRVNDDPVLDSLQDPVSYLLGVVGLATVIAAV
jgi:4-hydroxybenzoate polyprenyltransferase